MPPKAALLKRTRAQRIPFRPGDRYSNKGRIHSRRPFLSSSFFACKTAADHTFRFVVTRHNPSGEYLLCFIVGKAGLRNLVIRMFFFLLSIDRVASEMPGTDGSPGQRRACFYLRLAHRSVASWSHSPGLLIDSPDRGCRIRES
jgi:hypothetical protein